jgi:hypothetical protein
MKNFIIYLLILIPVTFISAQNADYTRFGILGGVNYQNMTGKDNLGEKLTGKGITGFHAGVNAQIPIAPEFYFQPGLLFSTKGSNMEENGFNSVTKLSYIELPLNLVYKGTLGNGAIMLGFGPYVGYGIKGKVTNSGTNIDITSDVKFQNTIETSDPLTSVYLKGLDIGGNIFVGYEMSNGIFLQLNTQYGMVNISPEDKRVTNSESSLKNIGFGLSLGYRI